MNASPVSSIPVSSSPVGSSAAISGPVSSSPSSTAAAIFPLASGELILMMLGIQKQARSAAQVFSAVKALMPRSAFDAALAGLVDSGAVSVNGTVVLTPHGKSLIEQRCGRLAGKDRRHLQTRIFPAIALGLRPQSPGGRRVSTPKLLRAALLSRLYALPLDIDKVTLEQAVASLAKRALAGRALSDSAVRVDPALAALAHTIDDYASADGLRLALLRLAVQAGRSAAEQGDFAATSHERDDAAGATHLVRDSSSESSALSAFAQRVQRIAASTSTPPFGHKTAIAQVYDAYGCQHADAGSLASFHQRLLAARKAALLRLLPLDQPGALSTQVLLRSQIETADGPVAFIAREAP